MGMVYQFSRVSREKLLSGKMDPPRREDFESAEEYWDAPDPFMAAIERNTVGAELDREDFIRGLVLVRDDGELSERDREVMEWVKTHLKDHDVYYVTMARLKKGIKTLKELDAKVEEMAKLLTGNSLTGASFGSVFPNSDIQSFDGWKSRYGYVEMAKRDEWDEKFNQDHVFYGWCKEAVDIVKAVFEVYGYREYHYTYPWQIGFDKGSEHVLSTLEAALESVENDPDGLIFLHMY